MSLPSKLLRSVRALHAPVRGEATDYRTVEKTFMFRCACVFRHVSCHQICRAARNTLYASGETEVKRTTASYSEPVFSMETTLP